MLPKMVDASSDQYGNPQTVDVCAPARIHCALLNQSGFLNRIDGGVGFSIAEPRWIVKGTFESSQSPSIELDQEHADSLEMAKRSFSLVTNCEDIHISVSSGIQPHIGLGSKTALLMAVGFVISRLKRLNLNADQIATRLSRAGTSGIGIRSFQNGGFIWDAGRDFPSQKRKFGPSSFSTCPPSMQVMNLDVSWLNVMHFRFSPRGLHGELERKIFDKHCPVSDSQTKDCLAIVAGALVPALVEKNDELLQRALSRLQSVAFKRIEWHYQDTITKQFKDFWNRRHPDISLGLSSMGPTLYCIARDVEYVHSAIEEFGATPLHLTASKMFFRKKEL